MRCYALNVAYGFMQSASICRHRLSNNYFLERPTIDLFSAEIGGLIFPGDEEIIVTDDGNYANELLAQPNANKMYSTPLHSQKNVTINKCDQRKFGHFFQERQE